MTTTFTKLLLAAVVIHLSLIMLGVADIPLTSLGEFMMNPDWDASDLLSLITDGLLVAGVATIAVGTLLIKNDLLVFAGLAMAFYSFAKPLGVLWTEVSTRSHPLVAFIFVSPIIVIYIMTLIAWWRGKD